MYPSIGGARNPSLSERPHLQRHARRLPADRQQAIEGFTGSLAYELAHFGVRAKLVEPGYAPTTQFGANALMPVEQLIPDDYAAFAQPILEAFGTSALTTKETDVAEGVWNAVHDTEGQLRFPAGPGCGGARRNTLSVNRWRIRGRCAIVRAP